MARRYTAREKITQVLARGEISGRALARKLRLPESTFRAVKGGRPVELSEAKLRKLTKLAAESRVLTQREARREAIKPPPRATVQVPARRLKKRVEVPRAPAVKVPGRIIELSAVGLDRAALFDLLWPYHEQAMQRSRRAKREPGSFRFVVRERARRPIKGPKGARGGPQHSAYIKRLLYDKDRAHQRAVRKARKEGLPPPPPPDDKPIYMTSRFSWATAANDAELRTLILDVERGSQEVGGEGWPVQILAVRIYPPGL